MFFDIYSRVDFITMIDCVDFAILHHEEYKKMYGPDKETLKDLVSRMIDTLDVFGEGRTI